MFLFVVLQYVLLLYANICESREPPSRLVYLEQGPVRGYKENTIFSFYGIPYATVPTGRDRFKAPLPAPTWNETFEAIDKEIVCAQSNLLNTLPSSAVITEDCLIVNVYVPETNETNLPVVIYVHGGAYLIGWGNMFTPKYLVKTKKVIAVTYNYRLGPQGFLCLGTTDIPGNAGMKDSVALFRWVKKNIVRFGGNPDDIIISGYSSGASTVELFLLSKMTKGFFKKAIPDSAASLSPYTVQLDPVENAKKYAKLLKFDNVDDIQALIEFYMTVPYEILNSGDAISTKDSAALMAPCIERDLGEERFLDDSPINILKSGDFEKVPLLVGFTDMDGLIRFQKFFNWKDQIKANLFDFLPADLQFTGENEKKTVAEDVRQFYFGNEPTDEKTALAFIDYFTDVLFVSPVLRSVKYQVEAGHDRIYLYLYSYFEDSANFIPYTNRRGANHCAQTFAILDGYWNDTIVKENDVSEDIRQEKANMKEIWLSFMTTGNPNTGSSEMPHWPPVGLDLSPYMSINKTLELRDSILKVRRQFWEEMYNKYYRYPIPPMLPIKYRLSHKNGKNP